MRLVLDAEAVNALVDPGHPESVGTGRTVLAAQELGRPIVVCAVTLAEAYRGVTRTKTLDAFLASTRGRGLLIRDTDRPLARLVGSVMTAAAVASDYLAGAHAVAAAVEGGGGVVLTGDPDDIQRLRVPTGMWSWKHCRAPAVEIGDARSDWARLSSRTPATLGHRDRAGRAADFTGAMPAHLGRQRRGHARRVNRTRAVSGPSQGPEAVNTGSSAAETSGSAGRCASRGPRRHDGQLRR